MRIAIGEERFAQLLEVKRADNMGQCRELVYERLEQLQEIRRKTDEIVSEKQCFTLKDLAVSGRDVIVTGVSPGPAVGAVLNNVMSKVIDGVLPNDREVLLKEIDTIK